MYGWPWVSDFFYCLFSFYPYFGVHLESLGDETYVALTCGSLFKVETLMWHALYIRALYMEQYILGESK